MCSLRFPINAGSSTLHIRLRNDFGYSIPSNLPPLGERSQGLRVVSESWGPKNESLTLDVAGVPGKPYDFILRDSNQIATVEGAKVITENNGEKRMRVQLPGTDSSYVHGKILIHFTAERIYSQNHPEESLSQEKALSITLAELNSIGVRSRLAHILGGNSYVP